MVPRSRGRDLSWLATKGRGLLWRMGLRCDGDGRNNDGCDLPSCGPRM